ncbi:uncharacterized protein LOC110700902 [Chenopodium quinoa]|uniref:uncharacterized protein LOC110700902 n=1 Tax=Chenopodium quinoa TaxID=63459 RepID=UPI000B781911|nr:uncharacterized protein LOC110700902 [Chenopodium quinoa]
MPLLATLYSRGVPVNPICVFYREAPESTSHLFRDCSFVRHLLTCSFPSWDGTSLSGRPFELWFSDLITEFRLLKQWRGLRSFLCLLWAIWLSRNQFIFRHALYSPTTIFAIADEWVSRGDQAGLFSIQLFSDHQGRVHSIVPRSITCLRGISTDSIQVCLILDGAWTVADCSAGAGWIFRRMDSDEILGGGSRACRVASALQAELQACLWGIQASIHRGFHSLFIYTDSAVMVSLLHHDRPVDVSCLWLLSDVRRLLEGLSVCRISKVPRDWVTPSHWLARRACERRILFWSF